MSLKHPMVAKLVKPVVVTLKDVPSVLQTLPAGATVEFDATNGLLDVVCDEKHYSATLQDFLDACSVDDVGRIAWP